MTLRSRCEVRDSEPIERPRVEVADILRAARDGGHMDLQRLTSERAKVLRQICACRTATLGGHADVCLDCGHTSYSYNSCRNRHCPRCQWTAQQEWIEGRIQRLLGTHYFHVVFTLPAELRGVAIRNQRPVYDLLFRAVSRTLLELGKDRLDATVGITAVLHTWARDLTFHPHIHCIVTGGGLSLDQKRWKAARTRYLFPQKVMSALLRGKFLAGLKGLFDNGELVGITAREFDELLERLYRKSWVVYAKPTMAGPENVIKYLGRYTHRVAISNNRVVEATSTHVTFVTRGEHTEHLSIGEFARRFLLHVLPPSFMKIRHYGLFAAANVNTKWVIAHRLRPYDATVSDSEPTEASEPAATCEHCGSDRILRMALRDLDDEAEASALERSLHIFVTPCPARGPPAQLQIGGQR